VRGVIARLLDRSGGTENAPVFLDPSAATAAASTDGDDSAWWTNEGATAPAEMTQAPADAPAYSEAALVEENAKSTTTRAKTKAEARAVAKAAAKAAADEKHAAELAKKVDKANAKNRKKTDAMSEKKRLAIAAKEEKARLAAAKREALEEEKVERDDVRARAKRELKAQAEWRKKQKRRVAIKLNGGKEGFWQGTSKPKPLEITNAVRSLAIILEVSPGEVEAVKMMAEEFAGNRIGDSFDRIYDRLVKDNLTLVEAFEPEELFPPVVHNMLRVGAKTAKPGPALRTAVDLMDAGNDNRRKMVNAIREPLIVTVLSLGILFATAWVVVPSFLDLYDKLNLEVGIFTQIVIAFANISMWGIGIGALIAVAVSIWWFTHGRRSLRVRVGIDRWILHAPLIGKGEQTGAAFQMFNILNSYLSVGSTEREALVNTASAMENRAIRRHLRATAQGLLRGQKTFADFLDDDMFPKLARSILATGQRTGQTTQAVRNLRDIYENESRIEGEQSVQKVVGVVSAISSLLFVLTATIVSIPPLEIFGATLSFRG
jgi:type IV pilus assembly protein PilC